MNIQEIVSILTSAGIEQNEANQEVKMLIEHFCGYGVKDIIMGRPIDYEKLNIVKEKAEFRAKTRQPIQYIIGKAYFMGDYYDVNENVLIPRDETEIVVRHAISLICKNNYKNVLEIGTGSGCIACAIAKYAGVDVTSVDISKKALEVAANNSNRLGVSVQFIESDLFSNIPNGSKFDLIISNPPYIPKGVKLQKEVQFEPKVALYTSETTGCEFYKKIAEKAPVYLAERGAVVFELGVNESELVKTYFEKNGYVNIVIEKDFANIDRVISAEIN